MTEGVFGKRRDDDRTRSGPAGKISPEIQTVFRKKWRGTNRAGGQRASSGAEREKKMKSVGKGSAEWLAYEIQRSEKLAREHKLAELAENLGADLANKEERQACEELLIEEK